MEVRRAILCVEDSDDDFELFSRALTKAGASIAVCRVHNFAEARQYLVGEPPYNDRSRYPLPQAAIVDLWLPDGSGLDVMKWMRSQPALSAIRSFVFTGSEFEADRQRCLNEGVDVLNKPYDLHEWRDCANQLARTI